MWITVQRLFSGILDRYATTGSIDCGPPREAPFGVPVVPEVRITARPSRSGGTTALGSPSDISSSSVGSGQVGESCQATKRLRRWPASSSSS